MHTSLRPVGILFLGLASAAANDTALHEGRGGPEPVGGVDGPESPVRMMHEELRVEFGAETTEVEAKFTFRNTQTGACVKQLVGFPDEGAATRKGAGVANTKADVEGLNSTGALKRVKTFVNGKIVPTELRYGEIALDKSFFPVPLHSPEGKTTRLMAWHAMEVSFPRGKDVTIERHYRVENGFSVYRIKFFDYTTATGGVWQGTIGKLTADVFLQDGLKVADLAWDDAALPKIQRGGWMMKPGERSAWRVISGTHVRLTWHDFEPRTEKARRGFTIARKSQWKGTPSPSEMN